MRLINETEYQELLAKIPMEERTFRKAVEVAEDMPTIDAVPVVWCKDCKFFMYDDYCCEEKMEHSRARENDFCSYGKRKDGYGNG